jgi:3-methyladenine DNA glycosylase AlkD
MNLSTKAKDIYNKLKAEGLLMGGIKKLAKEIKKDHDLAMELWETGDYYPRLLTVLILDKKFLNQELIELMVSDLDKHQVSERMQVSDWLLANQLVKSKRTIKLLEVWVNHQRPLLRRMFWTYQYRLRWTGKTDYANTSHLVGLIENNLATEVPEVQLAMNACAGWIGIYDAQYRERLVSFGKELGLYKEQKFSKGCTPHYLPEFIRIEVEKLENRKS